MQLRQKCRRDHGLKFGLKTRKNRASVSSRSHTRPNVGLCGYVLLNVCCRCFGSWCDEFKTCWLKHAKIYLLVQSYSYQKCNTYVTYHRHHHHQAVDDVEDVSVVWSVCLSVCLSHSCCSCWTGWVAISQGPCRPIIAEICRSKSIRCTASCQTDMRRAGEIAILLSLFYLYTPVIKIPG